MKSLKKSLDILKLFLDNGNDKTLGEISRLSGINKTSVSRIVSDLVEYGYLKQREKRGKYSLGTIYLDFSDIIRRKMSLRDVAVPYLVKLSEKVNESIIIAYGNGMERVFTETFNANSQQNNILRVVPAEGSADTALHSTCTGKILLAYLSEEALTRYFRDNEIKHYTPHTITDVNDMKSHLLLVRQEDIAFDDEELSLGVRGVASVLKASGGKVVGAIAMIAPSIRLTRARMRELGPVVKSCAMEISQELGFRE